VGLRKIYEPLTIGGTLVLYAEESKERRKVLWTAKILSTGEDFLLESNLTFHIGKPH